MKGLDFIVGGIPRGGTTAFADALNQHPDIFCYASETGLLPFAYEVGGRCPVPATSLPATRTLLRDMLRQNLVEMIEFNLELGSPEPPLRFEEEEVNQLTADVMRGLGPLGNAAPMMDVASGILASALREKSDSLLVGEKTPTNILALDSAVNEPLDLVRDPVVFAVVRRPFAVIRSMRNRLGNNADHFAAIFDGDIAQQAGFFVRFALACARVARRGAHLLRYETLAGNPRAILPDVLSALDVSATSRIIDDISSHIDYRVRTDDRAHFSAEDQATVDAITEPALAQLGYAHDPRSLSTELVVEPGWRVINGQFDDGFLSCRAVVMLVTDPQNRKAVFRFWHMFPGTVADGSDLVTWTVEAVDGRVLGANVLQGGGPASVEVAIHLDTEQGALSANGLLVQILEVTCSHAFVPAVHPFRAHPPSADRREISGKLMSIDFV